MIGNLNPVNAGLKMIGRPALMTADATPIGMKDMSIDVESVLKRNYQTDIEKNNAIRSLIQYLGKDASKYELEVQAFINTYTCGLFRDVLTSKHYLTMVGMLFLHSQQDNLEIEDCMIINSCKGQIAQYFDEKIDVLCIEDDEMARDIANLLNTTSPTRQTLSLQDIKDVPPTKNNQ